MSGNTGGGFGVSTGSLSGAAGSIAQGAAQAGGQAISNGAVSSGAGLDPLLREIPRPELNVVYEDLLRAGKISRVRIDQLNKTDVRSVYNEWRNRDRFDRRSLNR